MTDLSGYIEFEGISLHLIAEADIGATVALINEAYSYQDEAKGRPRIDAQKLRVRIDATEFYVARRDRRIVGCVYVERSTTKLHFGLLTVSSELRGMGIGVAVVRAIESYGMALQMTGIELDYMSLAPWLKTYYERLGYTETGEVISWGTINLVRMVKIL